MESGIHNKTLNEGGRKETSSEGSLSIHCPNCQGLLNVSASKKVQAPVCEKCNSEGHWVMLYRQNNGKK